MSIVGSFNFFAYLLVMAIKEFDYEENEGKNCPKCKEYLPLDNFYYREDRKIYSSWCIQCQKDKSHDDYLFKAGIKTKTRYWLIPDKPGKYKTFEEEFNTKQLLVKLGWKYNDIYHCWLKKGLKEIINGEIKWLTINEEEIKKKKYLIRGSNNKGLLLLSKKYRTVERPDYETLKQQINELGYRATGRLYGLSDNGIRKWLKFYEKIYNI